MLLRKNNTLFDSWQFRLSFFQYSTNDRKFPQRKCFHKDETADCNSLWCKLPISYRERCFWILRKSKTSMIFWETNYLMFRCRSQKKSFFFKKNDSNSKLLVEILGVVISLIVLVKFLFESCRKLVQKAVLWTFGPMRWKLNFLCFKDCKKVIHMAQGNKFHKEIDLFFVQILSKKKDFWYFWF